MRGSEALAGGRHAGATGALPTPLAPTAEGAMAPVTIAAKV